jgi:hypothetical protein
MLDIVKEISVQQSDLIKSFAIFYLLLVGYLFRYKCL